MELSGSASSFTFTNYATYHISANFSVGPGTATIQQAGCVKLDTNAYFLAYGNVSCVAGGIPYVFTSRDDNGYGTIIANSTANPGYAAGTAIWMYYQTFSTTLQGVIARWAQTTIRYDGNPAGYVQLYNSSLQDSTTGLILNLGTNTVYLSQDSYCNVTTPINDQSDGSTHISGSLTKDCGVVPPVMVNDPNRDLYDYDTNKNSQTECSFCVLDSTNIVAAFMSTHLSEYTLGAYYRGFTGIPSPRMASWAVSRNGGTNFTDNGPVPPLSTITIGSKVITNGAPNPTQGDAGDTVMTYDSGSDIVYLLTNPSRESGYLGFRLWTSNDKGTNFTLINTNVPGNSSVSQADKPMIKVWTNHTVYVAGSVSGANTWAAYSTNGGTTWTNYHQLEAGGRGVDIAIAQDGTVYFFWLANQLRYACLLTNNTWSTSANIGPPLNSTNSLNGSGRLLRFSGADTNDFLDDNAFPRVAYAYATKSIYITYADLPTTNNGTTDRGDIFLIEAGINWANHQLSVTDGPRRVNNDSTQTDQWNPSIAVNPSGTELFIAYYSRQEDPVTNSWIKAYGAKAYITNGLAQATFECFPISTTNFLPLFSGIVATPTNVLTFEPVWPVAGACVDANDVYVTNVVGGFCQGGVLFSGTTGENIHFCADDYTWASADTNYFYFAWCDRTRIYQNTRPDADIGFAKIKP